MKQGIYQKAMQDAVVKGATAGSPRGPEWARGCDKCQFGVIQQPSLWNCGVPFWIARAMALDIDGLCYVVYCDCEAGDKAMERDTNRRRQLERDVHNVIVVPNTNPGARYGELSWGSGQPPDDYIPGRWWGMVRAVCNED